MPRKLTQAELAAKLKLRAEVAAEELQKRLKLAQVNVAARIEALSERLAAATDARSRNALYAQIEALYDQQAKAYEDWMQDQVAKTAVEWRNKAKKDLKPSATLKNEFDRGLVKHYMEMVHEGNQQFLAGVFTDKMGAADLRQLRSAFVDTLRQQSIEGWTARETHKALQERWDRLAKNLRSDRFVDAAGRPWTNADYISMLTRTTLAKVHREAYVDGIVEEGYELSRIISDGDPCEVCRAWDGIIVDVSGNQRTHYPSLSQAYNAGWGHPNCGCHLEAVIDAIDGKEIERQRKQPAVDWSDPTAVQAYNDKIRIQGKRDEGMSARDAERDLKRDKLRDQTRLFGADIEKAINDLPREELDRMDLDKVPRIELAKKGDTPNSTRNSSLGGVIYLDKKTRPEDFQRIFTELQDKRSPLVEPKPTEPDSGTPRNKVSPIPSSTASIKVTTEAVPEKPLPIDPVKNKVDGAVIDVRKQGAGNEKFVVVTADGKTIEHLSGKDGGKIPREAQIRDATFVHQHPFGFQNLKNPVLSYGTSLSTDDIRSAAIVGYKDIRAVTPKRIYKMASGPGGWPPVEEIKKAMRRATAKVRRALQKQVDAGRLTSQHVQVLQQHMVNKLVAKDLGLQYSWDRIEI